MGWGHLLQDRHDPAFSRPLLAQVRAIDDILRRCSVEQGLVLIADTRTNAGLDDISTYRKLTTIAVAGERILALASAGNLALSQSVLGLLTEGLRNDETGEAETLQTVPTLFQAAMLIGQPPVRAMEQAALEQANLRFDVTFLFGGQIRRADGALPHLLSRQLHPLWAGCPLSPDWRTQVRQTHPGSGRSLQHGPVRGPEDQSDLDGLDHALEHRGRAAH